ncbi:MAG: hypothetical protein Q9226_002803 [Calogaya cf. arnoldii]
MTTSISHPIFLKQRRKLTLISETLAIWLRGSGWHRGYARAYPGMPSEGPDGPSKRSLPPYPELDAEPHPLLPQRQRDLADYDNENDSSDLLEPKLPNLPSTAQVSFVGGPRHKSEGIDPSWFGLLTQPVAAPHNMGVKKEWVIDEWTNPVLKRLGLTKRKYGKRLAERVFVA